MLLKENAISVKDWITLYSETKNSPISPSSLNWTYWEFNPNRIPATNKLIYELLSMIHSNELFSFYTLEIKEENKENQTEVITLIFTENINCQNKIFIYIYPTVIKIENSSGEGVSATNKKMAMNILENWLLKQTQP